MEVVLYRVVFLIVVYSSKVVAVPLALFEIKKNLRKC